MAAERLPRPSRRLAVIAGLYLVDLIMFWEPWRVSSVLSWRAIPPLLALLNYSCLAAWGRSRPGRCFVVVWLVTAVGALIPGYHPYLAVNVALFFITLYRPTVTSLSALAAVLPIVVVLPLNAAATATPGVLQWLLPILVWWLISVGSWAVAARLRAERQRVVDLDARRAAEAEAAVADERLRIARELHDIVSHSVSVIVLQAAGARRWLDRSPDKAEQALGVIEQTGQQTMHELRRLLVVLRPGEHEESHPDRQPGLADLDDLVDLTCRTGLPTTLSRAGEPGPLDPSVDLAVYRVVQEGLTNVRKHAPGALAAVRLQWREGTVQIEVTDELPRGRGEGAGPEAGAAQSIGHGLIGLRERVTAVGGRFDAGPTATGFRVSAELPVSAVTT